jgi:hypothetical protein
MFGIGETLIIVYGVGLVILSVRLIKHLIKLLQIVKKNRIFKEFGTKIVFIDQDCTPFSFFNYIFANKTYLSKKDLQHIIAHEKIHIRQYHSLDILLIEIITIIQWFNPFVWPYKNFLKETHEYLADNGVIEQGFNPSRYQMLLFEQHIGAKLFEFANNFKQSQIKRRITMMTKTKSRSRARMKYLLIIPMVLLLVLAFAEPQQVLAGSDKGGKEEATETKKDEKEKQKQAILAMKKEYQFLKEDEKKLRQKLEATTDSDTKKKLIQLLDDNKKKQEIIKKEAVEKGIIFKVSHKPSESELKGKLKALEVEIKKMEEELKSTDNPDKKKKFKSSLLDLLKKRDQIKKMLLASYTSQ